MHGSKLIKLGCITILCRSQSQESKKEQVDDNIHLPEASNQTVFETFSQSTQFTPRASTGRPPATHSVVLRKVAEAPVIWKHQEEM